MDEIKSIKHIGVLTSGGDAPGMNAVIRAVVRAAVYNNIKVTGIKRGYEGLLSADISELEARDVSDILQKGGTKILTARCEKMKTEDGQKRAAEICEILKFDALIVIGGDGSLRGGQLLSELGINVIGIPCTIDLDLPCSDYTIGFDTAVTTAMEAIGKIRDTSFSHERCSVVEVMGRDTGNIALWCAITCGAEGVLVPEKKEEGNNNIIKQILENRSKGKKHNLIIVAEGVGGSQELAKQIQNTTGIETRATILGYLQRGGSPTAVDRMHASMMGYNAIESLLAGERNKVMVFKDGKYENINLSEAFIEKNKVNEKLFDIIKALSI